MKRPRIRTGLFFGIVMSFFFTLNGLWKVDHPTTASVLKHITVGVISGTVAGVLVGYSMKRLGKYTDSTVKLELELDENILLESRASHCKGIEAVGGKLFLTDKKLIFKSHKVNIQNHIFSIDLNDIAEVGRYKNIGIDNGLSIVCGAGKPEKFIVDDPEKWFEALTRSPFVHPSTCSS